MPLGTVLQDVFVGYSRGPRFAALLDWDKELVIGCGHIVVTGGERDGDLAGHLRSGERRRGTSGDARGRETEAFVRPRRPLDAGSAAARMERGEHWRCCG